MPVLKKDEFYCVKCRKKVKPSKEPKMVKTKNNRHMLKGECSKCGTKVCRFVKSK
jgi:hypothetical protein